MFDCHVHSRFSTDSEMPAEAACQRAVEAGLEGIVFTDHLDIDYPEFEDQFGIDFQAYNTYMDNLKKQSRPHLKVLKGIEVGIQPHVMEETDRIVKAYDFDYVLASVHIIDREDPYRHPYYDNKTRKTAYERYLQEMLFMVRNFHDFDLVGHPEYIIRCATYDDRAFRYEELGDLLDELFRTLVAKGKGMELNTGSFRDKPDSPAVKYDLQVLKRYRELGGELISLGSDAHHPEYLGYKFDYFRELLLEAGFRNTVHFENRKPVFDKL